MELFDIVSLVVLLQVRYSTLNCQNIKAQSQSSAFWIYRWTSPENKKKLQQLIGFFALQSDGKKHSSKYPATNSGTLATNISIMKITTAKSRHPQWIFMPEEMFETFISKYFVCRTYFWTNETEVIISNSNMFKWRLIAVWLLICSSLEYIKLFFLNQKLSRFKLWKTKFLRTVWLK